MLKGKQEASCQKELCEAKEVSCTTREDPQFCLAPTPLYSANVVVIGAGMAGLSTANHLIENGVENITVLEALDRYGFNN